MKHYYAKFWPYGKGTGDCLYYSYASKKMRDDYVAAKGWDNWDSKVKFETCTRRDVDADMGKKWRLDDCYEFGGAHHIRKCY